MSLDSLLKIGQLKPHLASSTEIQRLLSGAARNLGDSSAAGISAETRFDAAYKALMQSALAALMANGYRPDTSRPGHYATTLQTLPKTIGIEGDRIVALDALRRKRNLADYAGEDIDESALRACREEAQRLLPEVKAWLKKNRPELIGPAKTAR